MIWIKRILPFLILIGFWYGYKYYSTQQFAKKEADNNLYALITAQTWIASVKYKDNPDRFIEYRDSLLQVHGLSSEKVKSYVEQYREKSEQLEPLATRIKICVDSLLAIEDSLSAEADSLSDSL